MNLILYGIFEYVKRNFCGRVVRNVVWFHLKVNVIAQKKPPSVGGGILRRRYTAITNGVSYIGRPYIDKFQ